MPKINKLADQILERVEILYGSCSSTSLGFYVTPIKMIFNKEQDAIDLGDSLKDILQNNIDIRINDYNYGEDYPSYNLFIDDKFGYCKIIS